MFELKGAVKVVNETVQVTDSFKKREFVLTDDSSQYPQDISFQLSQDNVDKLNGVKVGDRILVKFNVRGREWINPQGEAKYFNSLDAWFIQKTNSANNAQATPQPVDMSVGSDDNLPF